MTWGVRVLIPVDSLGRIRLPHYRIRYRDGWVRLGVTSDKATVVATLEDREGKPLPSPTQTEACAKAAMLGHAVTHHLVAFNKYEPGEHPGQRDLVQVAMA